MVPVMATRLAELGGCVAAARPTAFTATATNATASQTTVADTSRLAAPRQLPQEILFDIFSRLPANFLFRDVATVCSIWHRASFHGLKHLTIEATPRVKAHNLAKLMVILPALESLHVTDQTAHRRESKASEIHRMTDDVAAQFEGHPNLRRIRSSSDRIIGGAMRGCAKLEVLIVDFSKGSHGARNLVELFESTATIPTFRYLRVEAPSFLGRSWNQEVANRPVVYQGNSLRLGSTSAEALNAFVRWMRGPVIRLPYLKSLMLDADYLHLPDDTVEAISRSCPLLETLKVKYASLTPTHVFETAEAFPLLRELSIGKCDVWFYKRSLQSENGERHHVSNNGSVDLVENSETVSYADLVLYLTHHLPNLTLLHFGQCNLIVLPTTQRFPPIREAKHKCSATLRSLKVFDTSPSMPTEEDILEMVEYFPDLTELKMDVPFSLLQPSRRLLRLVNQDSTESNTTENGVPTLLKSKSLEKLDTLDLRSSKMVQTDFAKLAAQPMDEETVDISGFEAPLLPSLRSLSLWAPHPASLSLLLSRTYPLEHLTKLCLNYLLNIDALIPEDPQSVTPLPLPHLQHLELRFIDPEQTRQLVFLTTSASPNLRHLHIESAASRLPAHSLNLADWRRLATANPVLERLETSNLPFPAGVLAEWVRNRAFPRLESLWVTLETPDGAGP
ncbi:hypothetical protein DFJ73DRAFT_800098, partial [Zopfochytrium polystomum]